MEVKKFDIKTFYSKTWNDELRICHDKTGYFLMPSINTEYETINKLGFKEESPGKYVLRLDSPENYGLTWDDVVDVSEINGILAIICKKDGLLSIHPAFGGSGMAMDSYCMDLGTYGDWGDYIKVKCPYCHHEWYYNKKLSWNSGRAKCPSCKKLIENEDVIVTPEQCQDIYDKMMDVLPHNTYDIALFIGYVGNSHTMDLLYNTTLPDIHYTSCLNSPEIEQKKLIKLFMDIDKILSASRKCFGWTVCIMTMDYDGELQVTFEYEDHSENMIDYSMKWREDICRNSVKR